MMPREDKAAVLDESRALAKANFLRERSSLTLDNCNLENIWYILAQHASMPTEASSDSAGQLDYDEFCQAGVACHELIGPAVDCFFAASTFGKLPKDQYGSVALLPLFDYIMRSNAMTQTRIHLSYFDEAGEGFLTTEQLKSYLRQLMSELPGLFSVGTRIPVEFYITIASRKFILQHLKNGRLRIQDILPSESLAELLQMKAPQLGIPQVSSNWFNTEAIACVYDRFCVLDADNSGTLSPQEFAGFSSNTMTPFFISRVFEEHASARPEASLEEDDGSFPSASTSREMSLEDFSDFVLAWENRGSALGINYFFSVFDTRHTGSINQVDIYQFLKDLLRMWLACGQCPELIIEDVKDEIFDMVKPADPLHITAKDLTACGMSGTIISMLADVNLFWEYDNRESLLPIEDAGVEFIRA